MAEIIGLCLCDVTCIERISNTTVYMHNLYMYTPTFSSGTILCDPRTASAVYRANLTPTLSEVNQPLTYSLF